MVSTGGPYKSVMSLDQIYDGPFRVVGFGWELINTTPTMYKSGSILVYQCPQQRSKGGFTNLSRYASLCTPSSPATAVFAGPLQSLSQWEVLPCPLTPEEAATLPSSKQWDSKHGVYCVPRLTEFDPEFNYCSAVTVNGNVDVAVTTNAGLQTTQVISQQHLKSGRPAIIPYRGEPFFSDTFQANYMQPSSQPFVGGVTPMPYTASGCHITGLSPESTFTVVATYFVQILPMSDSSLLSLV